MLQRKRRQWRQIQEILSNNNISFNSEEELNDFYYKCLEYVDLHDITIEDCVSKYLANIIINDNILNKELEVQEIVISQPKIEEEVITNNVVEIIEEVPKKTKKGKK